MTLLLLAGALIVLACVLSNRISYRFGIPTLLAFIILGMVFGSDGIFKVPFEDYDLAQNVCSGALVIIMFYGGFGTNWKGSTSCRGKSDRPFFIGRRSDLSADRSVLLLCAQAPPDRRTASRLDLGFN